MSILIDQCRDIALRQPRGDAIPETIAPSVLTNNWCSLILGRAEARSLRTALRGDSCPRTITFALSGPPGALLSALNMRADHGL